MGINTPVEIIEPQTGAVTVAVPFKITQDQVPCTIMANVLAGSEEVDLLYSIDGGANWVTFYTDGNPAVLTATDNAKAFYSPMLIGVRKDATAGLCGVYMSVSNK